MTSTISRLDLLPPEILRRIATHSPTNSLLALIAVSRRFYTTLHDPTIYKAVVRNGNNHAPTCVVRSPIPGAGRSWDVDFTLANWDLGFLPPQTPVATYARWALADLRAREWIADQTFLISDGWCSDEDEEWSDEERSDEDEEWSDEELGVQIPCVEFLKFAPHLITHGYPLIRHISRGNMLQRCASGRGENPHGETLCFILALTMLYDTSHARESQIQLSRPTWVHPLAVKEQLQRSTGFVNDEIYHPRSPYSTSAIFFTEEIRARFQRSGPRWIFPPKLEKIPLKELLDVGLPFSELATNGKLPIIITRSFLEDGEWAGYYSTGMDILNAWIPPPMQRIRFQTEEVDGHGKIKLKGRGVNRLGGFDFTGWVRGDGKVRISQNHGLGRDERDWDGMLGPLGIIGSWTSGEHSRGMFWIWKREWSL